MVDASHNSADQPKRAHSDGEATRASLLSRVCGGADPVAWREFEGRYRELVYRYCRRRGLQHADAEDCTQAVLVNMVRSLPRFVYDRERGRFRDYLHRCAKNVMIRFAQRPPKAPLRLEIDVDVLLESGVGVNEEYAQAWEDEWVAHHMRRALEVVRAHVEPRSFEIFEACMAGIGTADVARTFGVSADAVHKVKQRMRDKLQEQVKLQVDEEDGDHG